MTKAESDTDPTQAQTQTQTHPNHEVTNPQLTTRSAWLTTQWGQLTSLSFMNATCTVYR